MGAGISGLSLAHAMQAGESPTGNRPRQILLTETQGKVGGRIVTPTGEGFLKGRGPEQVFAGTGAAETGSGCGTEARVGAGITKAPPG